MKNRMVFSQVLSVVPSPFTFLIFQTSNVCKSNYFLVLSGEQLCSVLTGGRNLIKAVDTVIFLVW